MNESNPKVSIGLPVYNGENYVAEAIESVLAQTFVDFELVIVDNASTDRTQEICEYYEAKDPRVSYYRNSVNLGAAGNFNRAFELSSAKYFKWLAHDDVIAQDFLEKCVEVLDSDPSVVLCFTNVGVIDENGQQIDKYDINLRTDSVDPSERFRALVVDWHLCLDIFGLIRSDALSQTPVMGNYGHGDGVLLVRLGLIGKFHKIHEYLFFSRRHPTQSMRVFGYALDEGGNDYHAYVVWFDPSKRGKIVFPQWRILTEYFKSIWTYRLGWAERLRCQLYLLWWVAKNRKNFWYDIRAFGKTLFSI